MSKRSVITTGIVEDGCNRVREATESEIRSVVMQEFALRLQTVPFWKRWWIRRSMEREVQRRLKKMAPPYGLY
jgi:hypothetical protein